MKPSEAKPRIGKPLLLRNYQKDLNLRLQSMHSLAHDMCGNYADHQAMRAELRKTKKLFAQLIALVE